MDRPAVNTINLPDRTKPVKPLGDRHCEYDPARYLNHWWLPADRDELKAIQAGDTDRGLVPCNEAAPNCGDMLTFYQVDRDMYGPPIAVQNGKQVTVRLTSAENYGKRWGGPNSWLYRIAWAKPEPKDQ